jgi:hypothetical protein
MGEARIMLTYDYLQVLYNCSFTRNKLITARLCLKLNGVVLYCSRRDVQQQVDRGSMQMVLMPYDLFS